MTYGYQELKEKEKEFCDLGKIKAEINKIGISNRILKQLENEYNFFIKNLEKK